VRASDPASISRSRCKAFDDEASGCCLSVRPITAVSQVTALGKFQILLDHQQAKLPNKSGAQTSNLTKLNMRVSAKVAYVTRLLQDQFLLFGQSESRTSEASALIINLLYLFMGFNKRGRPLLWSSGQSSWLHNGNVLYFL
jgi:hypothetical protein